MLKFVIIACLCSLVKSQTELPPMPPIPQELPPMPVEHSRVSRQAMPMGGAMPEMPNSEAGNPGNLGMQGLGNFPDPTAVIAKAQEVGRQFLGGRRRRRSSIVNQTDFN